MALHRVGGPVSSRAPGGQQGWEAFRERMRGYAAQGYAFDLEDNEPSIRCVAACATLQRHRGRHQRVQHRALYVAGAHGRDGAGGV